MFALYFLRHPAVEEAPLGRFAIAGNDHAQILELAPCQLPAAQARGLEADQDGDQERDPYTRALLDSEPAQRERHAADDQRIDDEFEPQAVAQHPDRREQERPEMEAIAHENEARRMRQRAVIAVVARRLVDCVNGHDRLSFVARMERSEIRDGRGSPRMSPKRVEDARKRAYGSCGLL